MPEVAIIAAMEREIAPLVRGWRRGKVGVSPAFFGATAIVVCGGIGPAAARKAAEATVAEVKPGILISAGFAGALTPELAGARVIVPASVISSYSGAKSQITLAGVQAAGVLVSATEVGSVQHKRALAESFKADAVDMEAWAVAEVADRHGLKFMAIKAISDTIDFPMPDLAPFIDDEGRFLTARFVLHFLFRPATWSAINDLASNSSKASAELSRELGKLLESGVLKRASSRPVRTELGHVQR